MIVRKEHKEVIIDLTGKKGNSFHLIALVQRIAKQLGYTDNEITKLVSDMTKDDYINLLSVVELTFGYLLNMEASEELLSKVEERISEMSDYEVVRPIPKLTALEQESARSNLADWLEN